MPEQRRKKRAMKKLNTVLSGILLILLLPFFFTVLYQKMQMEDITGEKKTESEAAEEELIGILAREISVKHSDECIKAQCVIARTNLLFARENQTALPEALTAEQMKELWGEEFSAVCDRLKELILETKGQTLQYDGRYIYAAYHSVSAGNTRNMQELYPNSDMPYLKTAACHGDTAAEGYLCVNYWEGEEFLKICRDMFPEDQIENISSVQVTERDSAGYVLKVQVGQTIYDGEEFRRRMGMHSTHFTLTELEGNVRVVTLGLGHGFGLSQHTAQLLAEDGKNYNEILQYFYPGAEITE